MCMYVCMYNMNIPDFSNFDVLCNRACVLMCANVRVDECGCLYICMYVCMFVCMCADMLSSGKFIDANTRMCARTQTDARALICIYERTCVQTVLRTDTQMTAC